MSDFAEGDGARTVATLCANGNGIASLNLCEQVS